MSPSPANIRREPSSAPEPKRHEVAGLLVLALSVLSSLAVASYNVRGGRDWIGPLGSQVSESLIALLGSSALLLPWGLMVLSLRLFRRTVAPVQLPRALGSAVIVLAVATGLHLFFGDRPALGGLSAGGLVGSTLGDLLSALVGSAGAYTVVLTVLLVALVVRTRLSVVSVAEGARAAGLAGGEMARSGALNVARAWRHARIAEHRARKLQKLNSDGTSGDDRDDPETLTAEALLPVLRARASPDAEESDGGAGFMSAITAPASEPESRPVATKRTSKKLVGEETLKVSEVLKVPEVLKVSEPAPEAVLKPRRETRAAREKPRSEPPAAKTVANDEPEVIEITEVVESHEEPSALSEESPQPEDFTIVSHAQEIERAMRSASVVVVEKLPEAQETLLAELQMPGAELLTPPPSTRVVVDEERLRIVADKLVKSLADYTIEVKVMEVHPGPVVTTYEVVPAAGTRLAKIVMLGDDIAMSLEADKVRIVAPIPGKGRVGFEIPNKVAEKVNFRELIETEAFRSLKGALPVALGKDVVGAPYFLDLATMPHLIVAGATGMGKSVGLNVMLTSLLYKRSPEDVRLLMIDPKMVELAVYDGIPHMLLPVVTDMKKSTLALRWVVDEMERRYSLFAQTGSRNIVSFNERVAKALAEGTGLKGLEGPVRTKEMGTTMCVSEAEGALEKKPDGAAPKPRKLPYILCVVDEFADLIMQAGKDIEAAVARLAQKARAAGIHVILATQRPSVDVITGMIKANFPARVSFKVAQKVDSRTILDQQGAEHLLGKGDMLILPPGSSDLKRVQCAFVSEDEVQRVTDHWRAQARPTYDNDILKPRDEDEAGGDDGPAEIRVPAEKYEKAVQLVMTHRKCSVSYVQRYLGIGYNVAARIVDKMEREGVVGAPKGPGKDREVLG